MDLLFETKLLTFSLQVAIPRLQQFPMSSKSACCKMRGIADIDL